MPKFTQLTADTAPSADDLVAIANDPGGTPASRKVTMANLLKQIYLAAGTKLAFTTIGDGEYLKRVSTNITSVAAVGTGSVVQATTPTITTPIITSPQISLTGAHGADDTYTGTTIAGLNAGATIAQWEAVYMGGASKWLLADANGASTYPARGLATAAYVDTNPAVILVHGTVRNDAWNWTIGGTIYLSGSVGALTQTPPAVSGDQVQQIGFALTADIAFFDFNSTYVTVA